MPLPMHMSAMLFQLSAVLTVHSYCVESVVMCNSLRLMCILPGLIQDQNAVSLQHWFYSIITAKQIRCRLLKMIWSSCFNIVTYAYVV
jgi:hypothetical protein